ncbi:MAG: ethyl tert-butyl ether degradation EthD, partial [Proteobacteria bacterium]|nr:ethyl tert-butyl ether degradation EthD [Pseudomonadota bacterium]
MIKAIAFIHKKKSLSHKEFQLYYEATHSPLAKSLLTFEHYERNYVDLAFS